MNKVTLKVTHHARSSNTGQQKDDILLNTKDVPAGLKEHGVVEVNQNGHEFKLLLQVRSLNNDMPPKGTVSLETNVALYFQFRSFSMVEIAPISTHHITLELVELGFRDQYFSRSDYFRFMNSMRNTVVYTNKKIEFLGCLKCTVIDMWMRGERVSSGFIGKETKIIFRSSTAVVHIFLQISEEMWDFDYFGDVYFEKAVSGFLTELFDKWVENTCSHDVTIVLFSRLFYKANEIDEFPPQARQCLIRDHRGRFYEDYFRVIIQNERYTEEWTRVLSRLKLCFHEYRESVLRKHSRYFPGMPPARLSTAAEGNFLETLNLTLNLYQNYNVDRNFDRTGKICVIITPGAGVFEVDRGLFNGTKQRVLDLGVGADLVCLGTQPLHAVPLFTFIDDNRSSASIGEDYNIPHWINHSFYRSQSEQAFRRKYNFVPRINLQFDERRPDADTRLDRLHAAQPQMIRELIDYEEHDASVFAPPSALHLHPHALGSRRASTQTSGLARHHRDRYVSDTIHGFPRTAILPADDRAGKGRERRASDGAGDLCDAGGPGPSGGAEPADERHPFTESSEAALDRPVVGSAECSTAGAAGGRHAPPRKALLNPFAPNRLNIRMTANRRRWAHVFPTDKAGGIVQLHHQNDSTFENIVKQRNKKINMAQICGASNGSRKTTCSSGNDSVFSRTHSFHDTLDNQDSRADDFHFLSPVHSAQGSVGSSVADTMTSWRVPGVPSAHAHAPANFEGGSSKHSGVISSSAGPTASNSSTAVGPANAGPSNVAKRLSHKTITSMFKEGEQKWHWGPLGEQEASPLIPMASCLTPNSVSVLIGVDWKSLITPACMPVTTDYFPSDQSLYSDFLEHNYGLDPSAINSDAIRSYENCSELEKVYCRRPLTAREAFEELVNQRLGWGYQLIVSQGGRALAAAGKAGASLSRPSGLRNSPDSQPEVYRLSQGRLFHILSLAGECINVLIYHPRRSGPIRSEAIEYRYRLMVPDAMEYAMSSTLFSRESSESFIWNRLDNYICTRGEGESYTSMDSLKFWRSRFFLLPSYNQATKKLIDAMGADPHLRFDIYEARGADENRQLLEGMMKFGDVVNKFRRVDANGQPPSQTRKNAKQPSHLTGVGPQSEAKKPRRCSLLPFNVNPGESLLASHRPDLLSSNRRQSIGTLSPISPEKELPRQPAGGPKNHFSFEASDTSRFRESVESSPVKATGQQGAAPAEGEEELSCKSSYAKILAAMTSEGMLFISQQKNAFPPHTFVAADAVNWLLTNVADIENDLNHAISLMKDMLKQRFIIHASGNAAHPFVYGFYFYSILPTPPPDSSRRDSDSSVKGVASVSLGSEQGHCFQLEWTEVAFPVRPPASACCAEVPFFAAELPTEALHNYVSFESVSAFCENQVHSFFSETEGKKILAMDIEATSRDRSPRPEWVTWQYAPNFDPCAAFDLELRWLVATGGRLNDIISVWRKKASQLCGLHLLPVPCNQFAFPNSPDCDPLRGPIFIHLELDLLRRIQAGGTCLFPEFPAKTRRRRLALFQESILFRFGFLPDGVYSRDDAFLRRFGEARTYVHCSGGMFIMIPDYSNAESRAMFGPKDAVCSSFKRLPSFHDYSGPTFQRSLSTERRVGDPPRKELARSDSNGVLTMTAGAAAGDEEEEEEEEEEVDNAGFIWAWNYMLTKRWRSASTGDELFQDRMLSDFRAFCANADGRLVEYWLHCQERCCEQDLSPTADG